MTSRVAVTAAGIRRTFARNQFDLAVRITRDNPVVTARAISDELELEHGVNYYEADSLAVAAIRCVRLGYEAVAA